MSLEEKKKELIKTEWDLFQRVQNEGGRASCQEDPETFFLMRRSQFTAWPEELLESWHRDLKEAESAGRNLLAEKYAWMMRSTAPERFQEMRRFLHFPTLFGEQLIEELVKQQLEWMEEYKERYPYLAAGNRVFYTSQDTPWSTSFETYLRGELYTYSERTLCLYRDLMRKLKGEGKNRALLVMETMVKSYGYAGLDAAEEKERKRMGN